MEHDVSGVFDHISHGAGLSVLFPAWAFAELAALPQGRGGGEVVRRHPERVRCVPVEDPAELLDIDRRQDLERLERLEQRNDARLL